MECGKTWIPLIHTSFVHKQSYFLFWQAGSFPLMSSKPCVMFSRERWQKYLRIYLRKKESNFPDAVPEAALTMCPKMDLLWWRCSAPKPRSHLDKASVPPSEVKTSQIGNSNDQLWHNRQAKNNGGHVSAWKPNTWETLTSGAKWLWQNKTACRKQHVTNGYLRYFIESGQNYRTDPRAKLARAAMRILQEGPTSHVWLAKNG